MQTSVGEFPMALAARRPRLPNVSSARICLYLMSVVANRRAIAKMARRMHSELASDFRSSKCAGSRFADNAELFVIAGFDFHRQ